MVEATSVSSTQLAGYVKSMWKYYSYIVKFFVNMSWILMNVKVPTFTFINIHSIIVLVLF